MAHFVARFLKNVLGDNGYEAEICQRSIEVEAVNQVLAAETAKRRFCEQEKVRAWFLHADRIQILETEFPSGRIITSRQKSEPG